MYLGIDIGSQSLKAIILDTNLRVLGKAGIPYQPSFPRPGWAEQDPEFWLAAIKPTIAAALASAAIGPADIRALAVCGQLDGCIPTDAKGQALAPAIIWMDRRAADLLSDIDPLLVRDRAGLVLDATHMAAKIRWFQTNLDDPDRVASWHQPVSFVVEALTGSRVMDRCLASTTMLYGLKASAWDNELLKNFGLDPGQLPTPADPTQIAGGLTAAGAALTGLSIGLPVAVGTGDDFSSLVGAGISAPGLVGVSLGTAETVATLATSPLIDPDMLVETHAFPGGYFHLGNPGWLSGGAVHWFAKTFSVATDAEVSKLAEQAPPGSDGLLFLPALSGAMAPRWIAKARGSFYGITPAHDKAHFARAVLEGTAFAMRDVIDRLAALGADSGTIRAMGGGAASKVWMQIRADLTGRPVDALLDNDASATGAALIAAVAIGDWQNLRSASAALSLSPQRVEPDATRLAVYENAYQRYRALFEALVPMFSRDGEAL